MDLSFADNCLSGEGSAKYISEDNYGTKRIQKDESEFLE